MQSWTKSAGPILIGAPAPDDLCPTDSLLKGLRARFALGFGLNHQPHRPAVVGGARDRPEATILPNDNAVATATRAAKACLRRTMNILDPFSDSRLGVARGLADEIGQRRVIFPSSRKNAACRSCALCGAHNWIKDAE
jgi:hypothetical protein